MFEVQESSLQNLEEDFIESSITIWAISNSVEDAASSTTCHTKKTVGDSESASSDSESIDWVGIGIWVVGGAIIITLLGVLLLVLNSEDEDETQDWAEGGYEDNLTYLWCGCCCSKHWFNGKDSSRHRTACRPAPAPIVQAGPPVPAEGLPKDGQCTWTHYGQQWLDNNR